jgi:glycosyltransferase involved in cell wall biosynthesis
MNDRTSIIIPACNEKYLQKTIDCINKSAKGDIEIIVYLDVYWPNPPLKKDDRITIIHSGKKMGMRPGIKAAMRLANGRFIMKCDAHCSFDEGFDIKLKEDYQKGDLVIPRRWNLNHETWEKARGPYDYLFLTFPDIYDEVYGPGFHGKKWKGEHGETGSFFHLEKKRKKILIDEILAFQGSCWFIEKEQLESLGYPDCENYGYCGNEAQEIGFKVWLSGGRVVRNKKTWYGHLHKSKKTGGRGFFINRKEKDKSTQYSAWCWMNNAWPGQKRPFKWLIDKFWPLEGWPEDWHKRDYSKLKLKFK